ncbi:MAG: hypothetical protein ACLS8T_36995 [Anaerobutyricum sp.]
MDYKLWLHQCEEDLDDFLFLSEENEQTAKYSTFWSTLNCLKNVAGLSYENQRLRALGYHRINFKTSIFYAL